MGHAFMLGVKMTVFAVGALTAAFVVGLFFVLLMALVI